MIVYSTDPTEGYLSEKGLTALRSFFAKDIKEIINSIVDDLGKDERIAALYDLSETEVIPNEPS